MFRRKMFAGAKMIAAFLCLMPVVSALWCSHFTGVDFPGQDFKNFGSVKHAYECERLCRGNWQCAFWTWLPRTFSNADHREKCYMKSSVSGSPVQPSVLPGAVSGFSRCSKDAWCSLYGGIDFPGQDFKVVSGVKNALECNGICRAKSHCAFWTWVSPTYGDANSREMCYLKWSNSGYPAHVTVLPGVVSGFSRCVKGPWCSHFGGFDFPGQDFKSIRGVKQSAECDKLCRGNSQCAFWTWVSKSFRNAPQRERCYLKRSATGYPAHVTVLKGVVSGFSRCVNDVAVRRRGIIP